MSKAMTGVGDFVMGTNAKIWNPTVTGGTATGQTQSNTTLSGTTTNTGTISGGSSSGMTHTNATLSGTTNNSGTISGGSVNGAAVTGGTIDNTVIGATAQANGNFVTVNAKGLVVTPNNVDLSQAAGIYLGGQTGGTHAYPAANFPGTTLVHIPVKLLSAGTWYTAWLVASW